MTIIIDRRRNPLGKNHVNRQRFLSRARDRIRETVRKSVTNKNLKDIGNQEQVNISNRDISEPSFHNDRSTGNHDRVLPGNKDFVPGDYVAKPRGSKGGSGKQAGDGEDSLEDFQFTLTRDEFLDYLFDELELPDFVKDSIKVTQSVKAVRSGLTAHSSPANLNIQRTFKNSIARRAALARPSDELIQQVEEQLAAADTDSLRVELEEYLAVLRAKQKRIPYIDETDLKYNLWQKYPVPQSQAVMFCLMDVSASMGEREKEVAKRFFLLLYLFLERRYEKIDIRFIRHTTSAEEVDEHEFFYGRHTGGTTISVGLQAISDIIHDQYDVADWNIYIAQLTDGDNSSSDNQRVEQIITEKLQPITQYFAYVQIDRDDQEDPHMAAFGFTFDNSAWKTYYQLSEQFKNIAAKRVRTQQEVWTIFRELFSK